MAPSVFTTLQTERKDGSLSEGAHILNGDNRGLQSKGKPCDVFRYIYSTAYVKDLTERTCFYERLKGTKREANRRGNK